MLKLLGILLALTASIAAFSTTRDLHRQTSGEHHHSSSSTRLQQSSSTATTAVRRQQDTKRQPQRRQNSIESVQRIPGSSSSTSTHQTNLIIGELANNAALNSSCAEQAEALLRSTRHPNTCTYNGVLKAHAKAGNPEQCERILQEMKEHHDETTLVSPDVWSYSTVMDAYARASNRHNSSATRVEELLCELQERYNATGDDRCQPNTIVYNTALSALAKSNGGPEAAEKADKLLSDMLSNNLADEISFNTVILAHARSSIPEAGERAELLLREMPRHNLQPTQRSYSTVLDAWSKCAQKVPDAANRALDLLEEMERLGQTNPLIRPNSVCYSTVIHAFALSRAPDKAERAWELLQRMIHQSKHNPDAAPSIITYNNVLNALATPSRRSPSPSNDNNNDLEPETMVRRLYQELRDHPTLRPDHFTYGTVLKACANVNWAKPDTPDFIQQVFQECCADGMLSFGVCYQLRQAATSELYRQLIPPQAYIEDKGHFSMKDMPKEWTRNVRERGQGSEKS